MNSRLWPSRIAALLGFLAVALGAFGAHGLKPALEARGTAATWDTAVFFHLVHAVMLWIVGQGRTRPSRSWWLFLTGIALFSGSLYALALARIPWLGPVTPLGGLTLLTAWISLAIKPQS